MKLVRLSGFLRPLASALVLAATAAAQTTAPQYLFTHLAGPLGGPGNIDGPAPNARFNNPTAVATDRAGNVYLADKDNHSIRKVTPAGVVSTVTAVDANNAPVSFSTPAGVAVDLTGNIFVADSGRDIIYRISPSGLVSTLAGASYQHYYNRNYEIGDGRDGTGTDARFLRPAGLATDSAGNVYVADYGNQTIRKITPAGVVTTIAGNVAQFGVVDGAGTAARFSFPTSVAVDDAGNVYVSDLLATIRKITPSGDVTTLAGTFGVPGSADGTGAAAQFLRPKVAVSGAGTVYVADSDNYTIRVITPAGVVTTLAGAAGQEGGMDGAGSSARFSSLAGVAVDTVGNIYASDPVNLVIRKITTTGVVTTFAGAMGGFGTLDGTGDKARFHFPQGLTLDRSGNIVVADFYNHSIRKITPAGVVTTFASASGSPASSNLLYYPSGVAVDSAGNTFVANAGGNSVLKVTADGTVSTFAGPPNARSYIFGSTDGPGTDARFAYPEGIAIDGADTLYVADSGNNTIRKITPDGVVSTLAGTARVTGSADGTGDAAQFNSPLALTVDATGNVFVADSHNHTIRKISPTGVVTTIAGAAGQIGNVDGVGPAARFSSPWSVTVDRAGNLFVGDSNNLTIRRITPDGTVTTIGGKAAVIGSADGIGAAATFYYPSALAIDSAGTLYIADEYNHAIRKGQLVGPPVITTQPASQTVAPGGTVQFAVTASSVLPLTYQWYVNDASFSGATTNTLSFTNARTSDAGNYTVVVTNQLGSVISSKALLTVASSPVTPPPPSPTGGGGGSMEAWFVLALLALRAAKRRGTRSS